MNERKWLKREGTRWVEKGLIEENQFEDILSLYEGRKSNNLLPILASILIGLGILTFIASNWSEMSNLLRFTLICTGIIGFNLIGMNLVQKGSRTLGTAWIGMGTLTFGAGIFLVAQMFHIVSYNSTAFIIWLGIGLLTYYVFPNKYIYLLTLVIGSAGMIYSAISFQSFSFFLAILVVGGIGILTFKENEPLFYYFYLSAVTISSITFHVAYDLMYVWMTLFFLFMYAVNEFLQHEKGKNAFKNMSIVGVIVVTFIHVFVLDDMIRYDEEILSKPIPYFAILLLLIGAITLVKVKRQSDRNWIDLLLFLPLFLVGETAGVLYLLLAFGYSLSILVQGYKVEEPMLINRGTFLFLISTLVAYIQLAWDFLPKSMFFLAGGILLFVLSWYLEKRRRTWFHESKGGQS
ncbi:DUF2157 domain-containing protein [Pseudalkalibacillus berkeleyi]|uniref:DUF2157 domain-containing protein n=1 Tax=Pseudalkalibacillus berkeleyi TaxID=1069813 RepID=A0ABS9GXB5_9BACL|nr:DUF2157 domain-containing protein [Pseudalkalibacillus berkeleyi]MCF6136296.1 DUF2157 domain-containing protein [Pseudalkalibacillus berkeleyi]